MDSRYMGLARRIVSEIVFSNTPGKTMKKWRELFGISQISLAEYLGIRSSTISDYESERRKSPGINVIRRFVEALIEMDVERGGHIVKRYSEDVVEADYFKVHEFAAALTGVDFVKLIEGKVVANEDVLERVKVYGFTFIDSLRAISEMQASDFPRLFGNAPERAFIFTRVSTGRSPMVVIRVSATKPSMVVLHGLPEKKLDILAKELAKKERIPLVLTSMDADKLLESLQRI